MNHGRAMGPCSVNPVNTTPVAPMEGVMMAVSSEINTLESLTERLYCILGMPTEVAGLNPRESANQGNLRCELNALGARISFCNSRLLELADGLKQELGGLKIL